MASQLSRDDVAHIARLARLELSAHELDVFAVQLRDILTYAAAIQNVDTSTVEPAGETSGGPERWRDDAPAASLTREQALGQAPDASRDAGLYRVPKVL